MWCSLRLPKKFTLSIAILVALSTLAGALTACGRPANCPTNFPAPPAGLGLPAQSVNESNIDLEFTAEFLSEQIKGRFGSNSAEDFGLEVIDVVLGDNIFPAYGAPDLTDGLALELALSVLSNDGTRTRLPGHLELGFHIIPYLVDEATVPDREIRRSVLGTTPGGVGREDDGVALVLEFSHIYGGSSMVVQASGDQLVCGATYADSPITAEVARGIFRALAGVAPTIAVPSVAIAPAVAQMTNLDVHISSVGMAISKAGVKIGLRTNVGGPGPLEQRLAMDSVMGPDSERMYDWAISIDTEFVEAAIQETVKHQFVNAHSAMQYTTPATVEFKHDGIHVYAEGTMKICGDWRERVRAIISPRVVALPDQSTVLRMPQQLTLSNDAKWTQLACALVDGWFRYPLGLSKMKVINSCPDIFGKAITFTFPGKDGGVGDTLYAADASTADVFLLLGRSRAMDSMFGRPPVPQC